MTDTTTILFLAANPDASSRLALDREARDIESRIQLRSCTIPLALKTRWAVSPDDLLLALNQDRPVVVHFSGHGAGMPGLLFHDDENSGGTTLVTGKALQRLFRALKDDVRVVVLNACYSEDQARLISDVVDCVIGMSRSIGDRAARVFAAAFYRALGHGRDVQNAFDQGVVAIDLAGLGEEETPHLLVRAGVTASQVRLPTPAVPDERASASAPEAIRSVPPPNRCVVTLRASLDEITPEVVTRLTDLLRLLSGDKTLTIESVEEGSVRLIVASTPAGSARLVEAARQGELVDLGGFDVSSVRATAGAAPVQSLSIRGAIQVARLTRSVILGDGIDVQPPADGTGATVRIDPLDPALRVKDAGAATAILMSRYGSVVREYCRRLTGPDRDPDAEDLAQTVFLQAFAALGRGERLEQPRSWLLNVARNRCLDAARARGALRALPEPDELVIREHGPEPVENSDVAARYELEQAKQALMECLDRLETGIRAAVILRFADELPYEEIARLTDSSPGMARTRVGRGLAALRLCLTKKGRTT